VFDLTQLSFGVAGFARIQGSLKLTPLNLANPATNKFPAYKNFQPISVKFMIRLLIFVSALLFCCNANAQIQSGLEYDVYFLAGQSNASGRGDAALIPAGSPLALPQTDVQFYWRKTLSSTNGNLTQNTFIPLQVGSGHGFNSPSSQPVEFGPEMGMGRTLADLFPDRNILIIKYGHGGSNLHTQWAAGGDRYNDFIGTVTDALEDITAAGATYQLKGTVWVQGEADAGNATNAGNYQANLTNLISRIRTDVFAGADAPFVLSRLSANQYTSVTGANSIVNVGWVDGDGPAFSTYSNGIIHFDANGAINLGNALGQEIGLLVEDPDSPAEPQATYSISADTAFGDNGASSGTAGPTFTDNMDGTFTLANSADSGNNNAAFIDSSDAGSISTFLGRALTSDDVVTVSGTVSVADLNYTANGVEFGLQSAAGFRSQPNMLFQIDADGDRGGLAPFYGTPLPGTNVNYSQTPTATEASLNDGYSFVATYSATDIVYTVSDVITTNETGAEPVGATSFTFSLSDAVAADATLQGTLDDYIANFPMLVGDSFAYFSQQRRNDAGFSSTISDFGIVVTGPDITLLGDVNCDGEVNFLDIYGDGEVNFLDITPFIAILSGS